MKQHAGIAINILTQSREMNISINTLEKKTAIEPRKTLNPI